MPALALAEAWRAYINGPASQATAKQWLQGQGSWQQIQAALTSVLANLWAQGFAAGVQAALALLKLAIQTHFARDALKRLQAEWVDEITGTLIDRIAEVLARGGTAQELADAINGVLGDKDHARLIVVTETNRAANAGRFQVYRNARVPMVRWITTSKNPCALCLENEASGPHHLGDPFPTGAVMPPQHPNCQCVLIPAE